MSAVSPDTTPSQLHNVQDDVNLPNPGPAKEWVTQAVGHRPYSLEMERTIRMKSCGETSQLASEECSYIANDGHMPGPRQRLAKSIEPIPLVHQILRGPADRLAF